MILVRNHHVRATDDSSMGNETDIVLVLKSQSGVTIDFQIPRYLAIMLKADLERVLSGGVIGEHEH